MEHEREHESCKGENVPLEHHDFFALVDGFWSAVLVFDRDGLDCLVIDGQGQCDDIGHMINRVMPTVSKAQEMKLAATQLRVYEGDYIRAFPNPKADKIEADMKRIIEKLQTDVESYSSMANSEVEQSCDAKV